MPKAQQTRKGSATALNRVLTVAGACVLIVGLGYLVSGKGDGLKRRAPAPQVVNITVPPPPPPPPPRPKLPEPPQAESAQQMVAETAVEPDPTPAAPSNDAPLGTGIKGDGSADSFGLGTSPGGGGSGTRLAGSGGGGTRWAGYSSSIKSRISEALSSDPRTRFADGLVELGVWLDAGGRIIRVVIRKSTAETSVEDAIKGNVLVGLQMQPPPSDMPQPIWLRTNLRRPN